MKPFLFIAAGALLIGSNLDTAKQDACSCMLYTYGIGRLECLQSVLHNPTLTADDVSKITGQLCIEYPPQEPMRAIRNDDGSITLERQP